ncbi:MAG: XdhC family protein [Anaerolineales bacterium]|nr:XdhC family protein [Anaerolineales bacterium]
MSIWQAVAELEEKQEAGVLCTGIRSQGSTPRHAGSKMLVKSDGSIVGSVGGGEMENRTISAALDCIKMGKPGWLDYNLDDLAQGDPGLCGGQVAIYMEPIIPNPTLVVVGAGHVGQAVAHLASWLDFRIVVSDDRPEFCNPEAVPDAEEFFPVPLEELTEKLKITPWTYVVMTTRSVDVDVPGLPSLLKSPAAYIGVIGSQRRWETTRKQLEASSVSAEKINRIRSPMGIKIQAETPEEIAVSILAEIIQIKHGIESSKSA